MLKIVTKDVGLDDQDRMCVWGREGFDFRLINYGKSPAHITRFSGIQYDVVPDPEKDLQIPPNYGVNAWRKMLLPPNDKDGYLIDQLDNPARTRVITSLNEGKGIKEGVLVVFGLIEYSDGISPKPYKTAFCYRYDRSLAEGSRLTHCGPTVYNEYT